MPNVISSTDFFLAYEDYQASPQNAIVYGGYVFQFSIRITGGTYKIAVHRSSDLVNWTELDTANRPTTDGPGSAFGVVQSGQYAYVAHRSTMRLDKFDMSGAGAWQATVATGGPAVDRSPDQVMNSDSRIFITRRADDSFVMLFQTTPVDPVSGPSRAAYVTLTGTTWGTATSLSGYGALDTESEGAAGLVLGTSDRVHFLWAVKTGATNEMWHRSLSSGGTLDTAAKVSDAYIQHYSSPFANIQSIGQGCLQGGSLYVPFMRDLSPGDIEMSVAIATSGANPTWSVEQIPTTDFGSTYFPMASFSTDFYGAFSFAHPQSKFFGITIPMDLDGAGQRNYLHTFEQFTIDETDTIFFIRRQKNSGSNYGAGVAYAIRTAAGSWSGPFELYRSPTGGGGLGAVSFFPAPLALCGAAGASSGARYSIS